MALLALTCGYPQPQPVVHDAPRADTTNKIDAGVDAPHDTVPCGGIGAGCGANTDCCSHDCVLMVCEAPVDAPTGG